MLEMANLMASKHLDRSNMIPTVTTAAAGHALEVSPSLRWLGLRRVKGTIRTCQRVAIIRGTDLAPVPTTHPVEESLVRRVLRKCAFLADLAESPAM